MAEFPYLQNIIFIWAKTIVPPVFVISLFLLSRKPSFHTKIIFRFFAAFFIFILFIAFAKSYLQFSLWKAGPETQYLLPPYNPAYFYNYAFFHFFLSDTLAFISAVIVGAALWLAEHYSHGLMLNKHEIFLGPLLAFVVGWPGVILFVFFVLSGMILWQLGTKIASQFFHSVQWRERVFLTSFLFASAAVLVPASQFLIRFLGLGVLQVTG